MRETWLNLVARLHGPARPRLLACMAERARHLEAQKGRAAERGRALARCVREIEALRAAAFAANDGVVGARMTELEREWRRLSRADREDGVMDLWATIAPASWIDRKRWRDCEGVAPIDAAVALASDPDGVEAAEAAVDALAKRLAPWGIRVGARVRWSVARDFGATSDLLAAPLRAAEEALLARDGGRDALGRARILEREVLYAAAARFAERIVLARALAHAAFVDAVWRASGLAPASSPATPLADLWRTGYTLADVDERGVTLQLAS